MLIGLFRKPKKLPVIHAMHPLIILCFFYSNPVSYSCNTKGLLASFTHYTCIRFFLCLSCSTQFLVFFLCAKALCSFIIQCKPLLLHPAFSGTGWSLTVVVFFFLLSSLWLITPFLCMRECMTISLIRSTADTYWVQWPMSAHHMSNSLSHSHVFLCDETQWHTFKDPER